MSEASSSSSSSSIADSVITDTLVPYLLTVVKVKPITDDDKSNKKKGKPFRGRFTSLNNMAHVRKYYAMRNVVKKTGENGGVVWEGDVVTMAKFVADVRKSDAKHVLLSVHGFNNQPGDAIHTNRIIEAKLKKTVSDVRVIPFVWPCDDTTGLWFVRYPTRYYADQETAKDCAKGFCYALADFLGIGRHTEVVPCGIHMHVMCHSMGNFLFERGMHMLTEMCGNMTPYIFRSVFMVSADVVNETFEKGEAGRLIAASARSVSVYYAPDDRMLQGSKFANARTFSRRLGHTGPESAGPAYVPDNVFAIDCTEFNEDEDPKGHSYQTHDTLLAHIGGTIKTGRVHFKGSDVNPYRMILS